MTRNSHQDALSESEFENLLDTCDDLDDRYQLETRFLLIALGRLGLRAGELAHLEESWIDWPNDQIHIPAFDQCNRSKDGDKICGYCEDRAYSAWQHNEDLTLEEAMDERWNPKTSNSVRAVPFDFDDEVMRTVQSFFMFNDRWARSPSTIARRVNRVLEAVGYDTSKTYPHALRATAATYHAGRSVPPAALQAFFGWAKLSVAEKYVRLSGGATQRAFRSAHSD